MRDFNRHDEHSGHSSWVYQRQINALYEDMPFAIISMALVVFLVFMFLGNSVSWRILGVWLSLFFAVLMFRAVSILLYSKRRNRRSIDYRQAEIIYTAGVILLGALWGSVALWLFPEVDLKGKILLIIVIMGIAAASNTTMGYRRIPIYVFTALLIVPLVFGIILSDFPNAIAVSIAMLIYMVFLLRTSTGFYNSNEKMLHMQEESIRNSQKLLIQREKAELANQAKSEFLSLMSHELRTPLNTVLGLNELQLLDRQDPLTAKQRKRSIKINDAGRHLLSLVNDVLDFSRIETGEIEINVSVIDCLPVLRDALKMVEGKAASRKIQVHIDNTKQKYWVRADYTRLKQVLVNLLDNAVKYNTQEGRVTVAFEEVVHGYLRISVIDTGYGIPENLVGELFKPFSRLNAEQMGIDGTGIGLSFSKQLVELMQGQIGVDSHQGQGSCFWIELPEASGDEIQSERANKFKPVLFRGQNVRIEQTGKLLLAEDNLVNQEVAVDMLEQSGFKVDVASNGEEALEALGKEQYKLVLMDCEMPVMDGFTATRQLRQRENENRLPHIPVIALTAHAIDGVREKCIACGMNDFLAKPFSYEEITAKVSQWSGQDSNNAISDRDAAQESDAPYIQKSDRQHGDTLQATETVDFVLDSQALDQLRNKQRYRKRNLVKRVIGLYLEQAPKLLEEMMLAQSGSDTETLVNIAHKLKSSSLTVGAKALAQSCSHVEESGARGLVDDAIIEKMPQQYQAVEKELREVLRTEE